MTRLIVPLSLLLLCLNACIIQEADDTDQDEPGTSQPSDQPDADTSQPGEKAPPQDLDMGQAQGVDMPADESPDMAKASQDMPQPPPDDMAVTTPAQDRLATKVNPTFSLQDIKDPTTRRYYQVLLGRIEEEARVTSCRGIPEDPDWADGHKSWNESACANNNYIQGRMLQTHLGELLDIFRLTGDKRLLDEVDRLMELTRSTLGTFKGSEKYVQWKPMRSPGAINDLSEWPRQFLNEIMVHSLVARVAAALQDNADVPGTPYAEHAAQWRRYLKGKNGYEEKIQQTFDPVFPFIAGAPFGLEQDSTSSWNRAFGSANLAHIYTYHVLYLHYMGRLTGEPAYAKGAMDMVNHWTRLKVDPIADAYVWPHSTILPDASPRATGKLGFAPVGYSSMTIRAAADMALDGQPFFANEETMSRFARTVTHHILDQEQFDQGNLVNPYRKSIGNNRPQWLQGARCSQTKPVLIRADGGDKCVDIDGVRFFRSTMEVKVELSAGAFNIVSVWPHKPNLAALERSMIYAFHAAAYDPKDPLTKGIKSLIFARLWVEGGYRLKPKR